MSIVGGLRHRLIQESLYNMLRDAISDLGWLDPGRQHGPIDFRVTPVLPSEEVPFNTVVLSTEDWAEDGWELGSNFSEFTWTCYVDIYAESDAVGRHFIGDIFDILAGRMSNIGRGRTNFPVYDYRQATPPIILYCDIEEPIIDRAHDFPKPFQQHWFACRFLVIDAYGDALSDYIFDGGGPTTIPDQFLDGGGPIADSDVFYDGGGPDSYPDPDSDLFFDGGGPITVPDSILDGGGSAPVPDFFYDDGGP